MEKNILITGGAGYIGSHAISGLKKAGYNPVVYDNLSTGHKEAAREAEFVQGDLADGSLLRETLDKFDINAVMHFAASALVEESVKDPVLYFENNVTNSIRLVKATVEAGVKYIIFSSTAAIYGIPENNVIKEEDKQSPINPYGVSKMMVERILRECAEAYDLHYISFRYFNAAGADADSLIGELHEPETHLIPLVLKTALGERAAIKIFGTDYETPDGTCVRDYIHVTDLIGAHMLGLEFLFSGGKSDVFNLGNGKGFSVKEVLQTAREVSGIDIPEEEAPRRAGDPPVLVASSEKAEKVLGWKPKISELSDIISSAWKWQEYITANPWKT